MNQVQEILESTGLDFEIIKEEFTYGSAPELGSGYYGLRNGTTGETLNSVKAGYTVSQNRELVDAVVSAIKSYDGKLSVKSGGAIHGGRRIFLQLEVEGVNKVGDDIVKRNITIIDSNDGTTGLSVGVGTLTMSCSNQFFQFYRSGMLKARHTLSIEEKIKELPKLIDLALSNSMQLIKTFKKWESTPATKKLAHELVKGLLGVDRLATDKELSELPAKRVAAMNALYKHIDAEMKDKGQNLWGLHSGVTSWTTHEKQHPRRINGRQESIILGTNYKTADKAFDLVEAMV